MMVADAAWRDSGHDGDADTGKETAVVATTIIQTAAVMWPRRRRWTAMRVEERDQRHKCGDKAYGGGGQGDKALLRQWCAPSLDLNP